MFIDWNALHKTPHAMLICIIILHLFYEQRGRVANGGISMELSAMNVAFISSCNE